MSLLKWVRRWKWQGCDGRHEDSFSTATCHHQCCRGVMGRDWRGLAAPKAVWGVSLWAQWGPSLKCRTHLACEQPAPNLAGRQTASQEATMPLPPDWDGKCLPPLQWLLCQWIRQGIERIANLREPAARNQRATGFSLPCVKQRSPGYYPRCDRASSKRTW